MSREEREKKKATKSSDFWWLSSPPRQGTTPTPTDTSTPKDESELTAKNIKVIHFLDAYDYFPIIPIGGLQSSLKVVAN